MKAKIQQLFGTNGIRGVAGKNITSDFAYRVGSSIGMLCVNRTILVGRDGRSSGLSLLEGATAGLLSQGNRVEDCGLITTPALQFLVKDTGAAAGIMITASHNPPEYNGFKIIDSDGIEIPRDKEVIVERLVQRNRWNVCKRPQFREVRVNPIAQYLYAARQLVRPIKSSQEISVVVDAGNGVASLTTPVLLRSLGCHVATLNDNIDGKFPGRPSEPRPENLSAICKLVTAEHADFGVAHDGDGDRAIFVDETGTVHLGDRSLALIADEVLMDHPGGKIVTPLNSSMALSHIAKKRHGKLVLTKVGSIFVSRTMIKEKAILGGEENGGIFYSLHHPVRDGTVATILILNAILRNRLSLSKLFDRLPRYFMMKEKIPCKDNSKLKVMVGLNRTLGPKVSSKLDGLRIDFPKGWLLIRPSGTEPLIRIYAEAETQEDLDNVIAEYKPLVLDVVKRSESD